jgi:cytochrome P450
MYVLVVIPITLFIVHLLLVAYQRTCAAKVTDTETKRPIDSVHPLAVATKNQNEAVTHYDFAKKFNFKNYLLFWGPVPVLMIVDPDDAKKILLNNKSFPKDFDFLPPHGIQFFGQNVVFVNGSEWRRQRTIMNPSFLNIERFIPMFEEQVDECLNYMDSSPIVHVRSLMTALTLDILGKAIFGYNFEYVKQIAQNQKNSPSLKVIKMYQYLMSNFLTLPKMLGGKLYAALPLPSNKEWESNMAKTDEMVYKIIKNAKEKKDDGVKTLLDLMIDSKDDETGTGMNDVNLRDNVNELFVAGHDTTTGALCFEFYCLARYPEEQERLVKEINEKIDSNAPLSFEMLNNLEYMDKFIKETLRLHPAVPCPPPRRASKTELIGTTLIPKGQLFSYSIYSIHRNPKVWGDDADTFRTSRWDEQEAKARPSHAFMPFGLGSRKCIGNHFSLLEQKVFLVKFLSRFRVELVEQAEVQYEKSGVLLAIDKHFKVQVSSVRSTA